MVLNPKLIIVIPHFNLTVKINYNTLLLYFFSVVRLSILESQDKCSQNISSHLGHTLECLIYTEVCGVGFNSKCDLKPVLQFYELASCYRRGKDSHSALRFVRRFCAGSRTYWVAAVGREKGGGGLQAVHRLSSLWGRTIKRIVAHDARGWGGSGRRGKDAHFWRPPQ